MILELYVWACMVAVGLSRVVVQPDGIISIITELEPEKTPVAYLQAVDRPLGGGSSGGARSVVNRPSSRSPERDISPPLGDGEFRVVSEKIRIFDPETGFKVVHDVVTPVSAENENNTKILREENERRRRYHAEPASEYRVVYPGLNPDGFEMYKESRNNNINDRGNGFHRRRKEGRYGYQTPRRDNTMRTDKTTRFRNDDEPTKVYKQTIVRPVMEEEQFRKVRKHGKPGRYVKFAAQQVFSKPTPSVGDKLYSSDARRGIPPASDPERKKSRKEFSSSTVKRFPDGYEQGNERRVESSSKYKTGSNERSSYRRPTGTTSTKTGNRKFDGTRNPIKANSINEKLELVQPVQEASSLHGSGVIDDVDDGLVDDVGVIYSGGGYGGGIDSHGGYGGGIDKEKHFVKENGKDYATAHSSAHGAKGQKGHDHDEAFSKGQSEQHGHDENKGYAVKKEGDKKSHLDKSSQYASGHQSSDGAKGSDFQKEKGHRKGHKKSGFRTVHHKDEYKKNEEFYDEEHNSGNLQQQGHKSEEHGEKKEGKDKKEYLDSGHLQASRGHEGGHEKGHGYNKQKGYQKEKGHSGHYGNDEEYGKKSGHKEGEAHGHSEFGGIGHEYH